ncbi:hypothetical protein [Aeoliella sp.]|uniref:hypothetical protein n=1 Tax=Aeoliella sp. TaxID=2795800 RepID=UPI003CCBDA02
MLNELLIAERGLATAGVAMTPRHPGIKDAGKKLICVVLLDQDGDISGVRPAPADTTIWTFGDNQKAFPLVRGTRPPVWQVTEDDSRRLDIKGRDAVKQRLALLSLSEEAEVNPDAGELMSKSLAEWLEGLQTRIIGSDCTPPVRRFAEAIRRFCLFADSTVSRRTVAAKLANSMLAAVKDSADDQLVKVAAGVLVGAFDKGKAVSEVDLLFDANDASVVSSLSTPIWHPDSRDAVSEALQATEQPSQSGARATVTCALTGTNDPQLKESFPNPKLPLIGPTSLYSRNRAINALQRYARAEGKAMPVSRVVIDRLAAAARALTEEYREGKTWRGIPGERPKQTDLMLAYVAAAPDAPVAEMVTSERDLEQLTKELVDAVKAKVEEDGLPQTPVRLAVLRRVDPGNRKAIASNTLSVQHLVEAAEDWRAARRLLPPHLTLPVPEKGKKLVDQAPPNIAPLSLISFTRPIFVRGGTESTDAIGITAAEAIAIFLDKGKAAQRRAARVLRLVLRRRAPLVVGCAHASRRGLDDLKPFNRGEALRTISVLCTLLHKLGRHEVTDMTDSPAYKLGQMLAAADAVHAGYCADVRGGQLPPSLLGNQVFSAAQKSPVRALEMLCRRWKPYGAWARSSSGARERAERLIASKEKTKKQRGWDIRVALRHARDWKPLAAELASTLPTTPADDTDRAELLLGYLAGLPKQDHESSDTETTNHEQD